MLPAPAFRTFALVFLAAVICASCETSPRNDAPPYKDSSLSVEQRVRDLLARMSVEEKIGQINMPIVREEHFEQGGNSLLEGLKKFTRGELVEGVGPAGGFFALANHMLTGGAREQAETFNELQRIATGETRLGIPLLQIEEGTHGLMCSGGTIFPEGPGLGSAWDTALVGQVYAAAAREARSAGIHELCTLVIEPARDPRLGRNQEGYSEDPYLCAQYARAIVRACQGEDLASEDRVIAALCHYPGQSQPRSGLERGAMTISERILREVFLPPWRAGISEAGALSVMATYPSILGVPTHASGFLLTDVLRGELGFEGTVLSEGGGIETLIYENLAAGQKDAGALALRAGVDVGIWFEDGYMASLRESLRDGSVEPATLDRAVRRVLRLKFLLGLFEDPLADASRAARLRNCAQHRDLALETARRSCVLLRNEGGLLPLDRNIGRIAVIGPNADHERNQLGDYVSGTILQDIVTVLEGIRAKVSGGTTVEYVKGCEVVGGGTEQIGRAAEAAARADVAVVVLGENEWLAGGGLGTSGEAFDAATLELTGHQPRLVREVWETGTPVVVVLVNGRPLATRWIADNIPAVLEAWLPGERGGEAVADILFGDFNPCGRLPVTVPRHAGQLPVCYDSPPSREYWLEQGWGNPYVDMSPEPLYVFGHGLGYTSFELSALELGKEVIAMDESLAVRCGVANTGGRAGRTVVQLYLRDLLASVTVPARRLRGFAPVELGPGESRELRFLLTPADLELLGRDLEPVVEPGRFEVLLGLSSRDIRLRGFFDVTDR